MKQLRKLFEGNGACEFAAQPPVAPSQTGATIFISKAMRLVPHRDRLDLAAAKQAAMAATASADQERDDVLADEPASLRDQLFALLGQKSEAQLLCDDFLAMDAREEEVKAVFDFDIPGRRSSWQQLRLTHLEASPSTFKVIDESGIVLALQPDLISGLARKVAGRQPAVLQKVYQMGQTFRVRGADCAGGTKVKMGFGPRSRYEATLCIVQQQKADDLRGETQTLCQMGQQELMQEVEILRLCESAFLKWFSTRFELRVSSSEVLDAIFEECQVSLADRIPLVKILYEMRQAQPSAAASSQKTSRFQAPEQRQLLERVPVAKVQELMRIKGSCEQIRAQLKERKHLQCRPRFEEAIDYFSRLEEMKQLFNNQRDGLLETNRHFHSQKLAAQRAMR